MIFLDDDKYHESNKELENMDVFKPTKKEADMVFENYIDEIFTGDAPDVEEKKG